MTTEAGSKRKTTKSGPTAATEAKVEEIAQTLRDGSFRTGVTLKAFAVKWDMCEQRVGELSSMASKKVRAEVTDPDRIAAKGYSRLEQIADDAMVDADKDGNNATHRKLALAATAELIKLTGVAAPTKATVAVSGSLEHLTDEQLEERAQAIVARMRGGQTGGSK